ncbi:hypothetical protein L4C36_21765 [Photobacterium japonica]|uniref:hypothetical protein n=1 Tax=Photobacterium japonica TaxID=2910235 RepID=UPI003D0CB0A1
MTHQLILTAKDRAKMTSLIDSIHLQKVDHDISVFIDTKGKKLTFVGGKDEALQSITLSINTQGTLKSGQWSLNGSYFKDMMNDCKADPSPLIIALDYSQSPVHPRAKITLSNDTLRACQTGPVREAHVAYLDAQKKNITKSVLVSTLQNMMREVKKHVPFDMIDIDHNARLVRIQRNQHIQELALPESSDISFSMTLTSEAAEGLIDMCAHTDSDTVNITRHNDRITFSTPTQTITYPLAGLAEFYQQAAIQYECEATLIVTIYEMKGELKTYHQRYPEIKQANTSHLLIEQDAIMVANIVPPFGFLKHIHVIDIDININQPLLYRVDLREILKVKIPSITEAKQMKLQILKTPDGKRVLGFFNERHSRNPYATVPIERDMASLPAVMKLKAEFQDNETSVSRLEPQGDLFGFGDI